MWLKESSSLHCCSAPWNAHSSHYHETLHAKSYSYTMISLLKDGLSSRKAAKLSFIPLSTWKDPLVPCLGPQLKKQQMLTAGNKSKKISVGEGTLYSNTLM